MKYASLRCDSSKKNLEMYTPYLSPYQVHFNPYIMTYYSGQYLKLNYSLLDKFGNALERYDGKILATGYHNSSSICSMSLEQLYCQDCNQGFQIQGLLKKDFGSVYLKQVSCDSYFTN